ncbi:flagellar motor protein MotB [Ornithinibacillus sp. BX22]|uniref:Flagellar motor protein MotB n=2 Tax=Ornithinibacillus TaxID=484508 RepID=A0A923L8Q0_9BACI|nr:MULTISPECIES: flagellar motor protein MotS [Ornithinibacillus]MBC5638628.1 flagellar motor protein MotB [Ornithinibacillus hominis]MBS3681997.1 flagellar motor protein MotB [Ornithinibacillus massiliensis]
MKRREGRKNVKKGAPKWMVTYSDMVTLILVFFILLFSMSQIDSAKFEAISESFKNRMIFDFFPSPVPMDNPTENTSTEEKGQTTNEFDMPVNDDKKSKPDSDTAEDSLSNLMDEVEAYLDEHSLNHVISANRSERGVELVLQDSILFDSGEADILPSAHPFLTKVGNLLSQINNDIKVEGHTDDVPMSSYRYPSNWELSGARASSVVRLLVDENKLDEDRFSIAGYSDTKPLVPNDSASNRSKNRRVEIVILEESYTES